MPKKAYIGVVELHNLVENGSFEDMTGWTSWGDQVQDSAQSLFGSYSVKLTGDELISRTVPTPIVGHKYYAREYIKTDGPITPTDCRFEVHGGDGVGLNWIYGWNRGDFADWTMISDVHTIDVVNGTSYVLRTFALSVTNGALWVDGVMLIDLTEAFGAGNEPDRAWCDANIPFFEYTHPIETDGIGKARLVKSGYVGIENFTKRNLPAGYTQVEYIQSSGTQYINTGIYPTEKTTIRMKAGAASGNFFSAVIGTSNRFGLYALTAGRIDVSFGATYFGSVATNVTFPAEITLKNGQLVVNGEIKTFTSQSAFTATNTLGLFAEGASASSGELYFCEIREGDVLVRDYVPCTNSAGTAGLYDVINDKFYTNAGTGTFTVGSTYKNVAHKIKKAYIGIGGVARPCWSSGELAYYGKVADLAALPTGSTTAGSRAAVTLENHALFAGGGLKKAYTIDKSLTLTSISDMSVVRVYSVGARAGNNAIVAGAHGYSDRLQTFDVYNASFTRSTLDTPIEYQRSACASPPWGAVCTLNNYTAARMYDENLTAKLSDYLSSDLGNYYVTGSQTSKHAVFVGKYGGYFMAAINSDGTGVVRTTSADISGYKQCTLPASFMGSAFFAGGYNSKPSTTQYYTSVDRYDEDLTHSLVDPLSVNKWSSNHQLKMGGTLENNLVFPGSTTDVYDTNLVHRSFTAEVAFEGAAANVGQYLLFAKVATSATEVYSYIE